MSGEKGGFPAQDPFNPDQNIEAGIRYFSWIFNSFYKDTVQATEKTIAAYNWKIERVSQLFGDGPVDTKKLPKETARYILCVMENAKKKRWKNIIWPIFIMIAALVGSLMMIRPPKDTGKLFANVVVIPTANSYSSVFPCPRLEAKDESVELIDQNCQTVRVLTPHDLRAEEFLNWSAANQNHRFAFYNDINGTMSAQQSRDGIIYFLLTTSGFCGSGGCSHILYGYNTIGDKVTIVEVDVDGVVRMLLSPDGKKMVVASAAFHDICEANSYLRIIDLISLDKKNVSGFEDQELPITHIQNLRWLSDDTLMFSTSHNGDCDPITIRLKREKEFIYNIFYNTIIKSRLIREYNSIP